MDANHERVALERGGDDAIDLRGDFRAHDNVRLQQPVQLRSAHAVSHRVEVRRRAVHDVAEATVPAVLRDDAVQVELARRIAIGANGHLRTLKEIGPPVRTAIAIDVQRAAEVDAHAGCAVRFRVRERAEDRVKLREHAGPRRQPAKSLSRVQHERPVANVGLGQPVAQPVADRAARRRPRHSVGRERRVRSIPLDRSAHCATSCVITS